MNTPLRSYLLKDENLEQEPWLDLHANEVNCSSRSRNSFINNLKEAGCNLTDEKDAYRFIEAMRRTEAKKGVELSKTDLSLLMEFAVNKNLKYVAFAVAELMSETERLDTSPRAKWHLGCVLSEIFNQSVEGPTKREFPEEDAQKIKNILKLDKNKLLIKKLNSLSTSYRRHLEFEILEHFPEEINKDLYFVCSRLTNFEELWEKKADLNLPLKISVALDKLYQINHLEQELNQRNEKHQFIPASQRLADAKRIIEGEEFKSVISQHRDAGAKKFLRDLLSLIVTIRSRGKFFIDSAIILMNQGDTLQDSDLESFSQRAPQSFKG